VSDCFNFFGKTDRNSTAKALNAKKIKTPIFDVTLKFAADEI
jgi:hypothetical protein